MREADFEALLRLVERLGGEQRAALGRALAAASSEPEAVRLLEQAFAAAPRCPHCAEAAPPRRGGHASGLRRYRCVACRKTFNALTGTSLARLRKRERWLAYGEALAAGMSLAKAAAHCGVHLTTSFRWRHRFLRAPAATREALGGVVEADETFFRRSPKGSRRWRRGDAPPGRRPRRRGEPASKRGLSGEQVPALVARDRAGHTADAVLPDLGAEAIAAALGPVVARDAVLCSDGAKAYAAFAAGHGLHHEPINVAAGIRVRDGAFHVQNVNAYHGRLKGWMRRFNGVATRYLPNYLGWRRTLERAPDPSASRTWVLAAARQISTANAN
jgi:transposase-like protein